MTPTWSEFIAEFEQRYAQNNISPANHSSEQMWICDLSHYGCISIDGEKATDFLQGQITCDVREVNTTQSSLGGLCEYKGRLYAIFYLLNWQNKYYLWMPKEIVANTITQLNKYAVFSKVTLQDKTNDLISIGIWGIQAEKYLSMMINQIPQAAFECVETEHYIIIKVPDTMPRFIMIGANNEMQKHWQSLRTHAKLAQQPLWELQNIKAGIPSLSLNTIDLFTPHQLNLPALNAVSFTKGCYTGQEIVARMHYLGKLKQHLYHADINCQISPNAGDILFIKSDDNLQEIGTIASVALCNNNQYQILAVLQDNAIEHSPFIIQNNNKFYLQNIYL